MPQIITPAANIVQRGLRTITTVATPALFQPPIQSPFVRTSSLTSQPSTAQPFRNPPQDTEPSLSETILDLIKDLLEQNDFESLESRFRSGEFTVTRDGISNSIDLCMTGNPQYTTPKLLQTSQNIIEVENSLPDRYKNAGIKYAFKLFAKTGVMPKFISFDRSTKIAEFVQDELLGTKEIGTGSTEYHILRKNLLYDFSVGREISSSISVMSPAQDRNLLLTCPESLSQNEATAKSLYEPIIDILEKTTSDEPCKTQIQDLAVNIDRLIYNKQKTQKLLTLLATSYSGALGIETPSIKVYYSSNPQNKSSRERGYFEPSNKTINIDLTPLVSDVNALLEINISPSEIRRRLFESLTRTFFDEFIHAWQCDAAYSGSTEPRLADYRNNISSYNNANYVLALRGEMSYYKEQPLEKDAEIISSALIEYINSRILAS